MVSKIAVPLNGCVDGCVLFDRLSLSVQDIFYGSMGGGSRDLAALRGGGGGNIHLNLRRKKRNYD